MKRTWGSLLLFVFIFIIAGNAWANLEYSAEEMGGLWQGLWHGLISFFTLPASVLFPNSFNVYNSNNNGFAYNWGFFLIGFAEFTLTFWILILAWVLRLLFWAVLAVLAVFVVHY
jgi:hypothetical protein